MYDVVIIGSGISGLYSAYKLQNKYSKIAVLENPIQLEDAFVQLNGMDPILKQAPEG